MKVLRVGMGVSLFGSLLACGSPRGESITIHPSASPAMVAFREDGTDAWRRAVPTSPTSFRIEVSGPYHALIVCDDKAGPQRRVDVVELARTPEEGPFDHPCGGARTLAVSVKPTQLTTVALGGASATGNVGFPLDLRVAPGVYDLVALPGNWRDGYSRIAIRHGVEVNADLDLGGLDLTAGAQPTIETEFTAENALPGELLSSYVTLTSGNTVVNMPIRSWSARFAPEAALAAGGHQTVTLSTLGLQGDPPHQMRSVSRAWRPGLPTSVALPAPMGPATLTNDDPRLSVSWSSLPTYDRLELERNKVRGGEIVHQALILSRAYVDETGVTSASLGTWNIRGFLPDWEITAETTVTRFFKVIHGDATDFEETSIGDSKLVAGS